MAKFLKIDGDDVPMYIHLMGSALGMRHKKANRRCGVYFYEEYRNYFSTAETCSDFPIWENMCLDGLAECISSKGDGVSYRVTDKGKKKLEEYFDVTIVDKL